MVDVLQMNADDGAKAVANVKSDSVLILLHALDTRATVKKAAQKQHDTLFSADGNSNESVGGNATCLLYTSEIRRTQQRRVSTQTA